jgi:anti-sigma regulatory factor (Ser/Thr protein kinase)
VWARLAQQHHIPFTGDYHAFRGVLARRARECGMPAERVDRLVLAANEVVANAVVHGEPPIAVHCWVAGEDFVCEVSDGGPGVGDPRAGWELPDSASPGGWGLALARRICDALEVADGGDESRVRLYMALA